MKNETTLGEKPLETEAFQEGLLEGRVEGLYEGMKKGEKNCLLKIVTNMASKGYDNADISKVTGLPEEEIKSILQKKPMFH